MKNIFKAQAMTYANKLTKLKTLEEQKSDLMGMIQELYKELTEEPVHENIPTKLKIANKKINPQQNLPPV
jgi:hypothetical protein